MCPYNFSESALVSIFLRWWDLENLRNPQRKSMKRSELQYCYRPFACSITKFTLNWSFIITSCKIKELWKLHKNFTAEDKLLINQLPIKMLWSRVEFLLFTLFPINNAQASLIHLFTLCSTLSFQRYLYSFQHMVLKIAILNMTGWFLIIAMLSWWNFHMMHRVGNITRISEF